MTEMPEQPPVLPDDAERPRRGEARDLSQAKCCHRGQKHLGVRAVRHSI